MEKKIEWRKSQLACRLECHQASFERICENRSFQATQICGPKTKNSNAENLVERGLEQKNLQPLDGVDHDVFAKECSKMMVQITNERRQNVQQKMQKQHMSEQTKTC